MAPVCEERIGRTDRNHPFLPPSATNFSFSDELAVVEGCRGGETRDTPISVSTKRATIRVTIEEKESVTEQAKKGGG